jgi:hypothetical protein
MHDCCDRPLLRHLRERGTFARADFLALLGAALASGCSSSIGGIPTPPISSGQAILVNGNVLTLTGSSARITAVAIGGGKILAVAAHDSELRRRYPHAQVVDLRGATLTPGFIEAHAHLSQVGLDVISHDVSAFRNMTAFLDGLRALAAQHRPGEWMFAQGIDMSLLPPHYRPPTLEQLDSVSTTVPFFVEDSTGHIGYVNSLALETAGVTPGQRYPGGGLIGGAGDGLPGIVYELPAFHPFFKHARKPQPKKLADAIFALLSDAQRAGVTTWHDPAAGLFTGHLADDLPIYEAIAANPATPVRLMSSLVLTDVRQVPPVLNRPRSSPGMGIFYDANEALWIPSLKIWVDGTPQGETAAFTQAYIGNSTSGFPHGRKDWTTAKLEELIGFAKRKGWSVLMHSNGDDAIDQAAEVIRSVFGAGGLSDSFRVRFEHCTYTRPDQIDTMQTLGVTPTFLNNHTYIWGDAFADRIIGAARAQRLDAAGDCARRKMVFSFHCDYGVSPCRPLRYMQTAVTRRTREGTLLGPDQAITSLEALKGCTIYPAMQLGFDHRIGTIEPGKDADFTELASDPTKVAPSRIAGIRVNATWRLGNRIPVA